MTADRQAGYIYCWILSLGLLLYLAVCNVAVKVEELDCSFEKDFCEWTAVNFKRYNYDHTLKSNSGPEEAQDKAYYIHLNYTEYVAGFTGTLTSQVIGQTTSNVCFRFWYHMYGTGMGTLSLYKGENKEKIWTKSGNQNNQWHCAAHLFQTAPKQISFEAVIGNSLYSVIAVDNIEIFVNTPCDIQDCEAIGTTNTENYSPTTTPHDSKSTSSVDPANEVPTTTAATSGIEEFLPYIAGVPAGVLVLSLITLFVCLKRKRSRLTKKENELMELNRSKGRHTSRPYNVMPQLSIYNQPEEKEEVYDFLDEGTMIPDDNLDSNGDIHYNVLGPSRTKGDDYLHAVSRDYETPIRNNTTPSSNNQITSISASVDKDDYEKPVTEDNYLTPHNASYIY